MSRLTCTTCGVSSKCVECCLPDTGCNDIGCGGCVPPALCLTCGSPMTTKPVTSVRVDCPRCDVPVIDVPVKGLQADEDRLPTGCPCCYRTFHEKDWATLREVVADLMSFRHQDVALAAGNLG